MEKKTRGLKIIVLLLVVILVAVLVVGFFYIKNKERTANVEESGEEAEPIDENTFPLEEFLVNLKSEGSFLKVKIVLMYPKKRDESKLEDNVNKIRDVINDQLRMRTSNDILDPEKSQKLKDDLLSVINGAIGDEVVHDIYFTDIVVQ